MAAGDVYRLKIYWTNGNTGESESTHIDGVQAGAAAPTMSALGDDVKDWWNIALGGFSAEKSRHPAAVTLDRVTLQRIKPLEAVIQQYTTGLPIAGTSGGDALPPQDSCIVSLRTNLIGRRHRGRSYLPPMTETQVTSNGSIDSTVAQAVADQYEAFLDTLFADEFTPSVYSKVADSAQAITSIKVDRIMRTQRRRSTRGSVYITVPH